MTNQSTINKLIEMRLSSMADAFWIQMNDTAMKEIPFEDRFGMLVDVKYTNRKKNRLKRLIWWSREAPPSRTYSTHSPAADTRTPGHSWRTILPQELYQKLCRCMP